MRTIRSTVLYCTIIFLFLTLMSACKKEEKTRTHEEIIRADLAEILELQGRPCREVVRLESDDRLDYRVECDSGDRYRIHVSAEGQVKVRAQQD